MAFFAVHFDIGSSVADIFGDRFFLIKRLAQLVEITDFDIGTVLDCA